MSAFYSFTIFPELFITVMPSISSREMGTLVTPMGPCDVSIFYLYFFFPTYLLIPTIHSLSLFMHNDSLPVFVYACLNLNLGGRPWACGGAGGAFLLPRRQSGGRGRGRLSVCGGHGGGGPFRPRHHLLGGGIVFPPHLGTVFHHGVPSWQVYTFPTEVKLTCILLSIFT